MTRIPETVPPLVSPKPYDRRLPPTAALSWLGAGWRDLTIQPLTSLAYGLAVYLVSLGTVWGLFALGWDYILFPALSGFLVIGPVLAIGLYEKSRRLAEGNVPPSLAAMIFVKAKAGGQILFIGVILACMMLIWMRAAVIIYALFFGLRPFPGLGHIAQMLFLTPTGWAMLVVGSLVGGLFAAFSFAVGVFSVPALLEQKLDAFTAMGTSMTLVWHNLPVMIAWGAIVMSLFVLSTATGLVGLIVLFPLLGHASWHAYIAVRHGHRDT